MDGMFPPIEPHDVGHLDVGDGHRIYYEQCGRADGKPALFLHGGPGSGCNPDHRRYFDPAFYRIVLFDQRGSGRSHPLACIENNTPQDLVDDIERLRVHLGIERWLVFGGSWGSTLALLYAQTHPERVAALVLRGIWLCRRSELDWWITGIGTICPELWRGFAEYIPAEERGDLLAAYHHRLIDPDPAVHLPAASAWKSYESNASTFYLDDEVKPQDQRTLAMSRIMAHYMRNRIFLRENQLLDDIAPLREIPGVIVHGRYDVICPIANAEALHRAWPEADYIIIPDAGHSPGEAHTRAYRDALVEATERFKAVS